MRYYLHIPFCRQRCTYCRFALDPRPSEAKIVKYLAHLIKEATEAVNTYDTDGSDFPIETLYFGGGTPSILNTKKLQILLSVFPHAFRDPNIEITIECNPEDITREYAEDLKSLGFTRISLGVQTMSDIGLRSIGRSSSESIYRALDSLRDAGHTNINIDVILGLPDMEEGWILHTIQDLHTKYSNIQHTSVYFLEYEHTYPKDWETRSLPREAQYEEYTQIVEYLRGRGFGQYEVSNFARSGYESRHNLGYWDHSNVLGLGLAAASYIDGQRSQYSSSFLEYYRWIGKESEVLSESDIRSEQIMFGLRTFSLDPTLVSEKALMSLCDQWLLKLEDGRVSPTLPWIFELDHIIGELI